MILKSVRCAPGRKGRPRSTAASTAEAFSPSGSGSGLSTPDILSLKAEQVTIDNLGVLIHVNRESSRRDVPVLASWEQEVVDLVASRRPKEWLVGRQRRGHSPNYINALIARSEGEQGLKPLVAGLRNTWLVHHMTEGTPLSPLAAAAGLESFRSIEALLRFVPESSLPEVRRALRRGMTRVA